MRKHPVGILYVSVDVRLTGIVEWTMSGYITVKTDEYSVLNGQETHINSNNRCEKVIHEIKTMTFIFLWNTI